MRIFLTFSLATNNSVKNNIIWYRNLYEPLIDLGYDVFLLNIDEVIKKIDTRRSSKIFKEKFSQFLLDTFLKEHKKQPFSFFFSYLMNTDIDPLCILEIKKHNAITANFSCNNTHQFYLTKNIAKYFDINLHSEKDAGEKFKSIGANPIWFQMAANPKYYYPVKTEKKYEASFIGSCYSKRAFYINQILENNIDIHVFGPGWCLKKEYHFLRRIKSEVKRSKLLLKALIEPSVSKRAQISSTIASNDYLKNMTARFPLNFHLPIADDDMVKTYNESKFVLGFLEVYDNHDMSKKTIQHLHLREFEVPMCGALYFTNFSEELAEHFEPEKEVVTFRNEYELIDKLKYYISNPDLAEEIRINGHKRAIQSHTYQKRFNDLFEKLNLK